MITEGSGLQILSVDVESRKNMKYSEIFDLCDVITLETIADQNLIRDVNKIRINEKWIVLFSEPLVYVFHRDGTFYRKVQFYGRGPGETTMPIDVQVDLEKERAFILAADRKCILAYSFDGEFVGEFAINSFAYGFTMLNSEEALIYNAGQNVGANDNGNGLVYLVNRESGISRSFIPIVKNYQRLYQSGPMEMFNTHFSGQVSFKMTYYDTIYLFDTTQRVLYPAYYLDFKGANVDFSSLNDQPVKLSVLASGSKPKVTGCHNQRFIGDILSLNASYGSNFKGLQILYDFPENKSIVIDELCNDFIGETRSHGIKRYDRMYGNYDEYGVFVIEPYQFLRSINALSEDMKKSLFKKYRIIGTAYEGIKEEDNPLLMIVSIKDF